MDVSKKGQTEKEGERSELDVSGLKETDFMDDPDLQSMRAEYEQQKIRKTQHRRENTADMNHRLIYKIEEIVKQQLEEHAEHTVVIEDINVGLNEEVRVIPAPESEPIDEQKETEEPDANESINEEFKAILSNCGDPNAPTTYVKEVETLWETYVQNVKIEKNEEEKEAFEAILHNPFLQRLLKPDEHEKQRPDVELIGRPMTYLLYDLLLHSYDMHSNVVSDYKIRKILRERDPANSVKDFKRYIDDCMLCAQANFLIANYEKSANLLQTVLRINPCNEEALCWHALTDFYSYRDETSEKMKILKIKRAEAYFLEVLKGIRKRIEYSSAQLLILWYLLTLTIEIQSKFPLCKAKPCNKAELYAYQISQADKYLGYIAWNDKNLGSQKDPNEIIDVLWELIKKNPDRPEAYLKLWSIYNANKDNSGCLEVAEKLFIDGAEYEGTELTTIIVLLYARSLMKSKYEVMAYQKLQYQYVIQSDIPMLLFYYGKYIFQSQDLTLRKLFLGSALSCLQECIRSCVSSRHGRVYYWMGKIYEWKNDIVNSLYCYGKAISLLKERSKKRKYVNEYINQYKEFQSKSNFVSERISLARQGKLKLEDKRTEARIHTNVMDAIRLIMKSDRIFSQYLAILYSFYVSKDIEETKRLMRSFNKTTPAALYVIIEIWNIQKEMKEFKEYKTTAKYIYKLIDSFEIPNHLWIKGTIRCAKTLIKDPTRPKYVEAINLLKGLGGILPPLPLLDKFYSIRHNLGSGSIHNTKAAATPNLLAVGESEAVSASRSSFIREELDEDKELYVTPRSKISRVDEELSKFAEESRHNSRKISEVEVDAGSELGSVKSTASSLIKALHLRRCSAYEKQLNMLNDNDTSRRMRDSNSSSKGDSSVSHRTRSVKPSIGCSHSGTHIESKRSSKSIEEEIKCSSQLFSVSTQWDYLYLMGKTAIKYEVSFKLGVQVLSDLLGLLTLFPYESTNSVLKIKYWLAHALAKKEALTILKGILPLAKEEKLKNRIQAQLDACLLCSK